MQMHPLLTRKRAEDAGRAVLRWALWLLRTPISQLLWSFALLLGLQLALLRFAPSIGRLPNVALPGALRNALLATLVLAATVHLFEKKTLVQAVGVSPRTAPGGLARGFLLGAVGLSLVVGVLFLARAYRVVGLGPGATPSAVVHAALLVFLVAIFEEVTARGILLRLLERACGSWAALVLSALVFGFAHSQNPGATVVSSLAIALEAGVLLGAAYIATRSLWLPIGLHAAWNFFEGPLYGARVSGMTLPSVLDAEFPGPVWLTGGDFGPEAGLPALVFGTLLGAAFLVLAVRRAQPFTPDWLARLLRRPRTQTAAPPPDTGLSPPPR